MTLDGNLLCFADNTSENFSPPKELLYEHVSKNFNESINPLLKTQFLHLSILVLFQQIRTRLMLICLTYN